MKLGLYLDLRKAPQDPSSWPAHYGRWLERIAEADRLGCPFVWLTEHHFFDDGYLTANLNKTYRAGMGTSTTTVFLRRT